MELLRCQKFHSQLLINALTRQVGTGTKMSGYPTNEELSAWPRADRVRQLLPSSRRVIWNVRLANGFSMGSPFLGSNACERPSEWGRRELPPGRKFEPMDSDNQPKAVSDCSRKVNNIGRVVIILSALTMIGGFLLVGNPVMGEMGSAMHASAIAFVGCGAWGIGTGIGLLRAWRWARISMLVFSSLLAAFGMLCVVGFLFMPNGDMSGWSLILLKAFVFLCALIPTGLGALCSIYFMRSNVKTHFQTTRKSPIAFA
jgi:hypothetical protein